MSTKDQARALMNRHHHMAKNRQQCLLARAAHEVGMTEVDYSGHVQGKLPGNFDADYSRGGATLS
ncbi:MAG: hypothetical protein MUF49_01255 [Oculatellaceae cyanobacterium Prado106]|nr:hypothetical protein [Oculatellaceae cyanobacterium Prado106]